jgi:2-polyprenyl-3-methyl-5-hydroxy-6-metoxy-1,4-benzoquinol methylase
LSSGSYYLDPDLYDIVYADIVADVEPYVALLRAAPGPRLEVCCGNGRLLVPVLAAGIDCEGLDLDSQMLGSLRRKLAQHSLTATLHHGDMRDFSLPKRYALITIPFNSFLHNLTQADQLRTLRCCWHHVEVGGRLVMNIFHPSLEKLMKWSGTEELMKELPHGDGRVKIFDRADDDRVEQVRRIARRIEFSDASGMVTRREQVTFDLRYIFKPEMELLLRVAGFSRWEALPVFAGYGDASSRPAAGPVREGDVVQWTAWKD